jgi:NADH dehydrogenase
LNSYVSDIAPGKVKVGEEWIACEVVLWATGVAASPIGRRLGAETDKAGRVFVKPDCSIPGHKNIFVIGDMASLKQDNGEPVPGLSPAAMQMGTTTAKNILADLNGKKRNKFRYVDKGTMATIGRSKAIAQIAGLKFKGWIAWMLWLGLHVFFLIGFRNRLLVIAEWFWAYLTRERSARLITGDAEELRDAMVFMKGEPIPVPVVSKKEAKAKSRA